MRIAVFLTALFAALPVAAENLRCPTRGYCTNALECSPDTEVMELRELADGSYSFGWVGSGEFIAQKQSKEGYDIFIVNTHPTSTQILTIGSDMQATFSAMLMLGGELYVSIQALRCERMAS